jgi:hypothetical protein
MGASSYLYAEAFPSQELLYWVSAHVHCFEALGGCPAIVVCDNLRSGVTRPHRYEPDVGCTPRSPLTEPSRGGSNRTISLRNPGSAGYRSSW